MKIVLLSLNFFFYNKCCTIGSSLSQAMHDQLKLKYISYD